MTQSTKHTVLNCPVEYDFDAPEGVIRLHPSTLSRLLAGTTFPVKLSGGNFDATSDLVLGIGTLSSPQTKGNQ